MKKASCLLAALSFLMMVSTDVLAGKWTYAKEFGVDLVRHNTTGWALFVRLDYWTDEVDVVGVYSAPASPSALPLNDAISDEYQNVFWLASIDERAFYGCSFLTSVTIPDSVTSIGDKAFSGCSRLTSISVNSLNPSYRSVDGVLFLKDAAVILAYPGGRAGDYSIPDGVTSIDSAFSGCSGLTSVTIPASVTSIGYEAFSRCSSLTNISVAALNPKYRSIDGVLLTKNVAALLTCPGGRLGGYTIPTGVTSISYGAFSGCSGRLTSVTIPDSVTSIASESFFGCSGLTSVTIPSGVTSIGYYAFSGCSSLTSVTIPGGVTSIGYYAFSGGSNLTNVTILAGMTSIGDSAFDECRRLSSVVFYGKYPGNAGTNLYQYTPVGMTTYVLSEHASSWDSHVNNGPVAGGNAVWQGRPIRILWPSQPPLISTRSPANNPAAVNEGTSVVFSVTANDSTDPDTLGRGMSNITWYVDGVQQLVTWGGASNVVTSTFTLNTGTNTVQNVAFLDLQVMAVAMDKQGCTTEINWTVRVNNRPIAQIITFPALPVKVIGDPDFVTGAQVSSALPIVYSNSNPAVVQVIDGVIHVVGAGTAVITAIQPGNFDFTAAPPVKQTLTVKARLTTEISGNGTVTVSPFGAGLYAPGTRIALTAKPAFGSTFLRWEDGLQTTARSLVMPNANLKVTASFAVSTNVPKPIVSTPGPMLTMVGIPFLLPLDITSDSLPTITVLGLPSGLSYSASTKTISGVPTASVTNRIVTITARNVNKTPTTETFTMTVDPLPPWAQGNFNGWFSGATGDGPISGTVTAQGKVSGKFSSSGTNYTFSSASYMRCDGDGAFWVTTTVNVAKISMPLTFVVRNPEGVVPQNLSVVDVWFAGAADGDPDAVMWRHVWKDEGMAAMATNYTGYYTATLTGNSGFGSGYLLFTVDKFAGVKTTGKMADGTAVSLSGVLILDETGRVFVVFYTAPSAYKGGGIFGVAEFFKAGGGAKVIVRLLDSEPFVWANRSQSATQVYGEGFSRELGLSGGWYDTLGNLYGYYSNRVLTVGTDAAAQVPEILVGTNRYDSAWWDTDGITLTVVTNKLGIMTAVSAPKAGTPVKIGAEYDYTNPTNSVGLTITLTRATGVFKGSFKAWFDYVTTHTSKGVKYEGVLTPERENMNDGIAGRGFFLWSDKSQYLNTYNRWVPYNFSWSYDFNLLLSD